MATQTHSELHEQHNVIKPVPKVPSRPSFKPLNLQAHEITALEIVLTDYLKDRQPTGLSKVGDMYINKILDRVRRLK